MNSNKLIILILTVMNAIFEIIKIIAFITARIIAYFIYYYCYSEILNVTGCETIIKLLETGLLLRLQNNRNLDGKALNDKHA